MPRFIPYNHSFASRLTFWIMLTLLLTMSAITYFIYGFSKQAMVEEAENRYQGLLHITNEKLSNVLMTVELAVANNVSEVEEHLQSPDKIQAILDEIVRKNPNIIGCGIGFEPSYYPKRGRWYEPYSAKRVGDSIECAQIGGPAHDYFQADWYVRAKEIGGGYWTEPYFDDAGGKIPLFTYAFPVRDENGRTVAVLAADISLEWLQGQLAEVDSSNNLSDSLPANGHDAYSFVIGRDGTYIVHPDFDRILDKNYFSFASETPDTIDDFVGRQMLAGNEGYATMDMNGAPSFVFYAPLQDAGWSMAIVVSKRTYYFKANILGAVILVLMALGLLVSYIVCRSAIKLITTPLTRFAASAAQVAKGRFDVPMPAINSYDEVHHLRDSFEEMQVSLAHYVEDLKKTTASKAALDSELKIASDIQMSMLPKKYPPFPERDDLDLYGQLTPAKAVGGDLYDYYMRDEKLFFCIGDVSGKGVPAALVMAVTRFLFRNISSLEQSPDRIMTAINEAVIEGNDSNMFVTLFIGVLDMASGKLQYCNAGHGAPALIGDGIGTLPCDTNIPVGLRSGWTYSLQEVLILQQTTIFLFTDGLSEAEDAAHHQFGQHRIFKVLRHLLDEKAHNPLNLIEQMTSAVHQFTGDAEQSDDMAMLAVQYTRKFNVTYHNAITIPNDVSQIPVLTAFVDQVCDMAHLDNTLTMQMNLAVEEAVVNVMKYAFPEGIAGDVHIVAQISDGALRFLITDNGTPFDPTARAEVDTSLGRHERAIGGLGIHLVRKLMDRVYYERKGDSNVLTLIKQIDQT